MRVTGSDQEEAECCITKKDLIRRTNVMVLFGPGYISNIMSLTMYKGNDYIWLDRPWGITVNCLQ